MTVRLSTGLRNLLAGGAGFGQIFNKGRIEIYTGSQPASADAAVTGTLLGIVSASSGAVTKENRASATITVSGSAGSINTVTVGTLNIIPDGAVPFRTDAATTASDLCDAINRNGMFEASVSGAIVTVKPHYGAGATFNGVALATTVTTLSATSSGNLGSGVSPVNGLIFGAPAAGVVAKLSSQVWSFNGIATGTAGWFRFLSSDTADAGGLLSGAPWYPRMDGSIATSGADLNLSNIAIVTSAPCTIDTFSWTQPAS